MKRTLRRFAVGAAIYLFRRFYTSRLERFEFALKNPRDSQDTTLKGILTQMEETEFGRCHRISGGMSREEFRTRVPVTDYDSLEDWVKRQAASTESILTPGRIEVFEKTSGSRGAAKWIPYNQAHMQTFERMFVIWCLDLFRSGLKLESGKVYFLISPKLSRHDRAPNGVPVGLEDDSGYLGSLISAIGRMFFVDASQDFSTTESFIADLSLKLLREPDLEVISVWSPSLLLVVINFIRAERTRLAGCSELCVATRDALDSNLNGAKLFERLWPKLKLISAWDAGTASEDASKVKLSFLHARFQGKGLLATEAAMTVPWSSAPGSLPLLNDVFFEFEDERDGSIRELHELEVGFSYAVIVTTSNGFLRYKIGDRVRAGERYLATPTLEFLGRSGGVSDIVGEKISPEFVEECLKSLLGLARAFCFVIPFYEDHEVFYVLAIDDPSVELNELAKRFEARLLSQYHYALSRRRGQLQHARAVHIAKLREMYFEIQTQRGAQAGQIKVEALVTDRAVSLAFDGALRRSIGTSRQSRARASGSSLAPTID